MMRKFLSLPLLLVGIALGILVFAGCAVTVQPTAEAQPSAYPPPGRPVQVDLSLFYNELAPYGDWFQLEGYGWVWSPYDVPAGWRPYTRGRWVYTDYGSTWASDFEWGWAPFHYGRWLFDPQYGWVWVPGREWAPAWVVWRYGAGRIGWAPLPPRVDWRAGNLDVLISPQGWSFVKEQYLFAPNLRPHLATPARNAALIRTTRNVTNYTVVQNRIIDRSLNLDEIERVIGRSIPRFRIVDRDQAPTVHDRIKGNEIYMFRHHIVEPPAGRASRPEPPRAAPGERRRTGTGPQKALSGPELLKRQESERQQLNADHESQRADLKDEHREELQHPAKGVSLQNLRKEHEAERRGLEDQIRQEKKLLEERHERERKGEAR